MAVESVFARLWKALRQKLVGSKTPLPPKQDLPKKADSSSPAPTQDQNADWLPNAAAHKIWRATATVPDNIASQPYVPPSVSKTSNPEKEPVSDSVSSRDPVVAVEVEKLLTARSMPKGVNTEGRLKLVLALLAGKPQLLYATVRAMRWPEMIHCPRCGSSRIKRRPAPANSAALDKWYYVCMDCEQQKRISEFDDTTGIPVPAGQADFSRWLKYYFLASILPPSRLQELMGVSGEILSVLSTQSEQVEEVLKVETKKAKEEQERLLRERERKKLTSSTTKR